MIMMPRLRAEESLEAVRIAQVAGGQYAENSDGARDAEKTFDDWIAQAAGDLSPKASDQQKVDQKVAARTALGGAGVTLITKETEDDNG